MKRFSQLLFVSLALCAAAGVANAGKRDATTDGVYNGGMAVFTIAKGGLMYAAALAGQKFTFEARKRAD